MNFCNLAMFNRIVNTKTSIIQHVFVPCLDARTLYVRNVYDTLKVSPYIIHGADFVFLLII